MGFLQQILKDTFRGVLLLLLAAYRTVGTTHLGGSCRFDPSCSEYAVDAAKNHSPHKAVLLIAKRVTRCRPGGPYGFDPVPAPTLTARTLRFKEINS